MFTFLKCSALNFRTWPFAISPNTHPVKDYSTLNVLGKGGLFYHEAVYPVLVTGENFTKSGMACSFSILGLVALGDASLDSAMVNGGISRISYIEHRVFGILGLFYHRHCTFVLGE